MLNRKLLIVTTILFTSLISGCASNVNIAKNLSDQEALAPEEGILVARVINTTGYRLPFNRLYIDPKEVNTSKEVKTILAYAETRPIGDSSLFAVSLAPGEYSLSTVSSLIYRGESYYIRGTYADPEFGVFKVQAGKVTDLGTIIYYPKPQDDVYKDIIVRVPGTADGQVLNEYFPKFASLSQNQNVLTWDEDDRNDQRFAQYASVAQNPVSFTSEVLAPDGSLYFLGKLGVILRYSTDDGFETLAVSTDLQLNTFAQNDAGDRVAGGYESALFYQAEGDEWESVSLPDKATVHYLAFYQENEVDLVYSVDKYLYVSRFDKNDLNVSRILNTYDYVKGWEFPTKVLIDDDKSKDKTTKKIPKPHNIKNAWVTRVGDKTLLKVTNYKKDKYSHFDSTDVETYSFSADTWEMKEAKESDSMDSILSAGAVELGIKQAGYWSWTGRPTYYSRASSTSPWREVSAKLEYCKEGTSMQDNGTCTDGKKVSKPKFDRFSFLSAPWFWDDQNGLAIVNFADVDFWSGERKSETKILTTNNGGVSWGKTELTLPKEYCTSIVTEISDRILLSCEGATSDFFESTDHAETWQHVRQQQDF